MGLTLELWLLTLLDGYFPPPPNQLTSQAPGCPHLSSAPTSFSFTPCPGPGFWQPSFSPLPLLTPFGWQL